MTCPILRGVLGNTVHRCTLRRGRISMFLHLRPVRTEYDQLLHAKAFNTYQRT